MLSAKNKISVFLVTLLVFALFSPAAYAAVKEPAKTAVAYKTVNAAKPAVAAKASIRYKSVTVVNTTARKTTVTKPTAPTPTPTPTPKPSPTPAPSKPAPSTPSTVSLSAAEQQMVNLVNQERAKAGLAPLVVDSALVQSAREKSKDMVANNYFSHNSPTYGGFAAQIRSRTADYTYVGENLAGNKNVSAAHTALMNSAGHRANILNPNYTHIGVGITSSGQYGLIITQHFGG
ncbi:MAG: CAP domain-containing protein [Clostridia bacterium]|nr:CAP domain-containing protein [Clostridia bacterium]